MKGPINDEELLAYILGETDPMVSKKIQQHLQKDPELRQRWHFLCSLKEELQSHDVSEFFPDNLNSKKSFYWKNHTRLAAFSLLFFILGFSVAKIPVFNEQVWQAQEGLDVKLEVREEKVDLGHERPMNVL